MKKCPQTAYPESAGIFVFNFKYIAIWFSVPFRDNRLLNILRLFEILRNTCVVISAVYISLMESCDFFHYDCIKIAYIRDFLV